MTGLRLKTCLALLSACTPLLLHAAAAKAPPPLMSTPQVVRDLYYGDALFYFYQGDYFQSLVRLNAARSLGRVAHHEAEADLLMGALYLSLGQHVEAGRIFQALLNDNVSVDVRNRTWFYLGKLWYQRNYFSEAETALNSIQGELPKALEPERRMLFAQVLMSQNRYDEAIRALEAWRGEDDWGAYARFNLGVALVREQRVADGEKLLDSVGQINAGTPELAALRDKANLALGFTYLKAEQGTEAKRVLQRVRLEGPQSNKALLGLGWADSVEKQYNKALAPWLELKSRNLLDSAVQEAYLAIPYAYGQLGANGRAAESYGYAIESFRKEGERIDQSIQAIRAGSLFTSLLSDDQTTQIGWYSQLKTMPDAPETRYLYPLLASNVFQEALKNYRDLRVMQQNLESWRLSVDAFKDMIDTRRVAYAQRVAASSKALADVDVDALESQVVELSARLDAVERDNDAVALATPHEQALWQQVQQLDTALSAADVNDPLAAESKEKLRLIRGVLYWDFNANYKARLWREKKELRELEVASKETRRRVTLVDRAHDEYPQRTEEFGTRVATMDARLTQLVADCRTANERQGQYVAELAVRELEAEKQRLAQYVLQAQFALAEIYDRASADHPSDKGAAP